MRTRRLVTLVGATSLLLAVLAWPAAAGSVQTQTAAEAWYQSSILEDAPICILPCPEVAAPVNPYPSDTVHVGISGGREVARTYLTLDLDPLPTGAPILGGEVRLVAAGPDAGTAAAELADMVACGVRGTIEPVEGGQPADAPPYDCSASAPLELVEDDEVVVFTFDLAAFSDFYPGVGNLSVAVLPSEAAAEASETWRVAFHGRDAEAAEAEPITAEVRYADEETSPAAPPPDPGGSAEPAPFDPAPAPAPSQDFAPGPSGGSGVSPPPLVADIGGDDEVAEPQVSDEEEDALTDAPPEPAMTPVAAQGYAYPQVWLLPLAFLCVGALLVRALTQDYELPDDAVS